MASHQSQKLCLRVLRVTSMLARVAGICMLHHAGLAPRSNAGLLHCNGFRAFGALQMASATEERMLQGTA